jgi:hypothetical protein
MGLTLGFAANNSCSLPDSREALVDSSKFEFGYRVVIVGGCDESFCY